MEKYIAKLKAYAETPQSDDANGETILNLLYEAHSEQNGYDNEQIKQDFHELYRLMNGVSLQEMDKIIYPVCTLCRGHEQAGFIEGIKVGIRLSLELQEK